MYNEMCFGRCVVVANVNGQIRGFKCSGAILELGLNSDGVYGFELYLDKELVSFVEALRLAKDCRLRYNANCHKLVGNGVDQIELDSIDCY